MKVWRGFTLVLWVSLLTLCLSVFLYNLAVQSTILNASTAKTQLAKSGFYTSIRDDVLAGRVMDAVNERFPGNKLIDKPFIQSILPSVFTKDELQRRIEPVIDTTYRWLDSKEPEVTFSVTIQDKKDAFYKALEPALQKKITALPECSDYAYPPEEAILNDLCRPDYVTASEATQAAMGSLRVGESPLGSTLTQDSFTLGSNATQALGRIPTYLNFLWVLNLIAIAVGLFAIIMLLIARRLTGVIAIGCSLLLAGIAVWAISSAVTTVTMPDLGVFSSVAESVSDALLPKLGSVATRYGFISALSGLVITGVAGFIKWRQRAVSG